MRYQIIVLAILVSVAGACSDMRDDLQQSADLTGPVALAANLYYLAPAQETLVTVDAAANSIRRSPIAEDAAAIIPLPDKQRAFVVHTAQRALGIIDDSTGTEAALLEGLPQNFTSFIFDADASRALALLNNPGHEWNREQMLIDPLTAAIISLEDEPSLRYFQLKERGDVPQHAVFSPSFMLAPEHSSLPSDSADIFQRLVVVGSETLWIIDPDRPEETQTALHLPLSSPANPVITFSANMDDGDSINDKEYIFVHDTSLSDLFVITMTEDNAGKINFSINEIPVGRSWDTWFYVDDDRLKVLAVSSSGLKVIDVASSEITPVAGAMGMSNTLEQAPRNGYNELFIPMSGNNGDHVLLPTDAGLQVIELPSLERRGDRNITTVESITGFPFDIRHSTDSGFATLYYKMYGSGSTNIKIADMEAWADGNPKALRGLSTAGNICHLILSESGDMLGMMDGDLCGSEYDYAYQYDYGYWEGYTATGRLLMFDPKHPETVNSVSLSFSSGNIYGPVLLNPGDGAPVFAVADAADPAGYVVLVDSTDGSGTIFNGFGLANLFD